MKTKIFTAGLMLLALLSGCGGGGSGEASPENTQTEVEPAKVTEASLFVHPTDPTLLSFDTDTGEQFTLLGTRDLSGNPTSVGMVRYVDPEGKQYQISYDERGVPKSVINESGWSLSVDFFTEKSGGGQSISRSAGGATDDDVSSAIVSIRGVSDGDAVQLETVVDFEKPVIIAPNIAKSSARAAATDGEPTHNVEVNVRLCGSPTSTDGGVAVTVKGVNSDMTWVYPAKAGSQPGQYYALIPQKNATWLDDGVEEVWDKVEQGLEAIDGTVDYVRAPCQRLAKSVSIACAVLQNTVTPLKSSGITLMQIAPAFCTTLAAQIEVLDPIPGDFPFAYSGCMALLTSGDIGCSTLLAQDLNAHPDPTSDDSINVISALCDARLAAPVKYINSAIDGWDNKLIQAVAGMNSHGVSSLGVPDSNPNNAFSKRIEVPATGPFPTLTINHKKPTIDRLVITPTPPDSSDGYTARADFSCVRNNELMLAYQGSDGYTGADFSTASWNNKSLSIDIPPRSDDVEKDVFVVTARDPFVFPASQINMTKTVAFATTPPPVVVVTATDDNASEQGTTSGIFTIARDGDTKKSLTVSYTLSGTATPGSDYVKIANYATIPAGDVYKDIFISVIDDSDNEGAETVTMTITSDTNDEYVVGSPSTATISIEDNDVADIWTTAWKSPIRCNEAEGSSYARKWSINLRQNGSDVTGNIYFHACPGGGRVAYALTGSVADDSDTIKLDGRRNGGRGGLYSASPRSQKFTLTKNRVPAPNFAP